MKIQKSEAEIEKEITQFLESLGFRVLKTSANLGKAARGVSKGLPDLIVFIPDYCLSIGIEVKKSEKHPRSESQVKLNNEGCTIMAWSVESALEAICKPLSHLSDDSWLELVETFRSVL